MQNSKADAADFKLKAREMAKTIANEADCEGNLALEELLTLAFMRGCTYTLGEYSAKLKTTLLGA